MNLSGSPIDYLIAFAGGVALSFTPCVYPLIPVSVGYIAIRAAGSRLKGFSLSFVYTTGIAITYSLLGLFVSLSGTLFGAWVSHPLTDITTGSVIFLFGLSMLDIFHFSWPRLLKPSSFKFQGYLSVLLLGLSSGLVISPCISPVLGSILTFLVKKKNILYGTSLLFVFAYGLGLVFILAGTFSSMLTSLPRSGKWMVYIQRICALLLIGMGAYYLFMGIRRM